MRICHETSSWVIAMNEDEAFVTAIRISPGDSANRLVYADWLEERSDPRGELVRLETEHGQASAAQ